MSLGQKALGGFFWTLFSNGGNVIITLGLAAVLGRLLSPEDFATVAMIYIFFEVSQTLVNSGFAEALIRQKEISEEDKSTVFYINSIASLVLFIVLWVGAPWIAEFYNKPVLGELLPFMSMSVIFNSLVIVQRAYLSHQLAFKKMTKVVLVSSFLSGIIAVWFAYLDYGVWALAYKYVSQTAIVAIGFYIVNPWFPKKGISKKAFSSLFGFGSKLLLSGVINTVYENVYKVIIGKFYAEATLGFYDRAKYLIIHTTQTLVNTLQTVTYPILGKTQDDLVRLKLAYRKIIMASSFIIFPFIICIGVFAEPIVLIWLGDQWGSAVPILQVLCVSGLLYHLHSINLNILKVLGRSDLFLKLEIIKKVMITVAIIFGLQFGIWGLLWAQVISSYLALVVNLYYTNQLLDYSYSEQFKDILPILLLSVLAGGLAFVFKYYNTFYLWLELSLGVSFITIAYFSIAYMLKMNAFLIIGELLGSKFNVIKKYRGQ